MTQLRTHGDDADEILDMTPASTPDPTAMSDNGEGMTPAPSPDEDIDEPHDMASACLTLGAVDESADLLPASSPHEGEPDAPATVTYSRSSPVADGEPIEQRAAPPPQASDLVGKER